MSFGGKNSDRHLPEENRRADSETGDIYFIQNDLIVHIFFVYKSIELSDEVSVGNFFQAKPK